MIIKIEDSLDYIINYTNDCLNIYFGRLCHHHELELTDVNHLVPTPESFETYEKGFPIPSAGQKEATRHCNTA
jgi:hypothetical protein